MTNKNYCPSTSSDWLHFAETFVLKFGVSHGKDFVNNKDLASLVEKSPNLKVTVIDGADHFFSGKQTNLYTIIESILEAQQTWEKNHSSTLL